MQHVDEEVLRGLQRTMTRGPPQRSNQNLDHGSRYRLLDPIPDLDEDVTEEGSVEQYSTTANGVSESNRENNK